MSSLARTVLELQRDHRQRAETQMISVQRDCGHTLTAPVTTELDDQARAIICRGAGSPRPESETEAVKAVKDIIAAYYSDKSGLVSGVTYSAV